MSETKANSWLAWSSSNALQRALRLSVITLGIGLLALSGAARAADDDDDDKTFEEKIIENLMSGLGATSMERPGIDYRERSPLVVPPKLDLPPPASSAEVKAPNWPKDPDEARRRADAAARKKEKDPNPQRTLLPSELNAGRTAAKRSGPNDPMQPGTPNGNPMLSPTQLGYTGGLSIFGGNKSETAPFTGEPTRETLTQPPPGYQTPSPNYAYGTGPKESLNKNYDVMTGKYR